MSNEYALFPDTPSRGQPGPGGWAGECAGGDAWWAISSEARSEGPLPHQQLLASSFSGAPVSHSEPWTEWALPSRSALMCERASGNLLGFHLSM